MPESPYRVMVVDDSGLIRGLTTQILEKNGNIKVIASAASGKDALTTLESNRDIEAVILDIEMPVMDGLETLPHLIKADPQLKVIMCSSLTRRNAKIALQAIELGACDCVAKPNTGDISGKHTFGAELIEKIVVHVDSRRRTLRQENKTPTNATDAFGIPGNKNPRHKKPGHKKSGRTGPGGEKIEDKPPIKLRPIPPLFRPKILAIGSSTGGPRALFKILGTLGKDINIPIIITQHMPRVFTSILADHIASVSGIPAGEGVDGEEVQEDRIYVAPGDHHMLVTKKAGRACIAINQKPPINFCRPAADPMLESAAAVYGPDCLALILTGMGCDGTDGSQHVVDQGGVVIAQDEKTSAVWGMPRSVATRGLCSAVIPVEQISGFLRTNILGNTA